MDRWHVGAAGALVNGASIIADDRFESVQYFHLEFANHEMILAEGAWSESFADDKSRERFDNVAEYRRLFPQARSETARFYAPRVAEGFELEATQSASAYLSWPTKASSHLYRSDISNEYCNARATAGGVHGA